MPDNLDGLTVQRIVVRNGLSHDLADQLVAEIKTQVAFLDSLDGPMPREDSVTKQFTH